jgi:hypothetical protein
MKVKALDAAKGMSLLDFAETTLGKLVEQHERKEEKTRLRVSKGVARTQSVE